MYKRFKLKRPVDNYICIGCESVFNRHRALLKHQGGYWPGCPS